MSAFVLEFNAPVPTQDGHPPLTLQPNAPALIGTVTFTPEAAEGYTGFVTLHTNDADQLTLPIGLSGTGVVCPANSEVNAMGECVCSIGFNDCDGACVDENTLTACGASCTDCTVANLGDGTEAMCSAGQCDYTCLARWYDLDTNIDDATTTPGWDGCEYACPQHPALGVELCNGIDDNCNGERDEGLNADVNDQNGSNDDCSAPTDLGRVNATPNGVVSTFQRTIYPTADTDWFQIMVAEGDDNPECIGGSIPCFEGGFQSYRSQFSLTSPSGAAYEMQVVAPIIWEGENVCTLDSGDKEVLNGTSLTHDWERSSDLFDCLVCSFDISCYEGGYGCLFRDYQPYWIRIQPTDDPDNFSCEPYTLTITTTATGGS
ncbi:MAG: hypothetical protein GY822_28990 [Deltaproteobacteria bacterium]|nr:hypothetical protein [Deltaproteobacteria bacterium]